MAQHRGESRFPVLVILLKQVPPLWKLWPALPEHTPFLGAMLQDCLTWAQKRACVDHFCEQNSIAFLATVHSGIPIPRQSGGTPRCESEEDAHVSCPQVPASRWPVPEMRYRPLGSGRERPALFSSASLGGPGGHAETSQHYPAPRVSLGSGPWREPPGLAASAPSEPYGPRARAGQSRAPGPSPKASWVRTGSSSPALAQIFNACEARALLKALQMCAAGALRASHYTPPPQVPSAGRPTWTRRELPQRDCAWRRQGRALTAGSVPLCARAGLGAAAGGRNRTRTPGHPQAQRFRVGHAPQGSSQERFQMSAAALQAASSEFWVGAAQKQPLLLFISM